MCCKLDQNFQVQVDADKDYPHMSKGPDEDCPRLTIDKDDPFIRESLAKSQPKYESAAPRCKETLERVATSADRDQQKSTEGLSKRSRVVEEWRLQVLHKVKMMREEITLLEGQRQRLWRSLNALQIVEYISAECATRRTARIASDLVYDGLDQALENEKKLCSEVRQLSSLLLAESEEQLESNKTCKNQLEFDWSDKTEAYRLETINVGLKNTSANISFYPGVARFPANQSDEQQWQFYTEELLKSGQTMLDRSHKLRKRIEQALELSVTDLRKQADCVELQLKRGITEAQEQLQATEIALQKVLQQITETESLEANLRKLGRQADLTLKVAQTRLYNREQRPRVEQTRDQTQFGLINETKNLSSAVTDVTLEIDNANETAAALYHSRALLQRNVAVKKKSLYVDAVRCQKLRLSYPDTNVLLGLP